MYIKIIDDKCTGCGLCAEICPVEAIFEKENGKYEINQEICISCLACERNCNYEAIEWGYEEEKKHNKKVSNNLKYEEKEKNENKIVKKIKTPKKRRKEKIKKILRFIVEDNIAPVLETLFLLFIDGAERLFKK